MEEQETQLAQGGSEAAATMTAIGSLAGSAEGVAKAGSVINGIGVLVGHATRHGAKVSCGTTVSMADYLADPVAMMERAKDGPVYVKRDDGTLAVTLTSAEESTEDAHKRIVERAISSAAAGETKALSGPFLDAMLDGVPDAPSDP